MSSADDAIQPKLLTSADVALALGVSQTTIKRWIDNGLLPAHRTKGGHRRIHPADLWKLIDSGRVPHLDVAAIKLALRSTQPTDEDCARPYQQLKQLLVDGDRAGAQRIITQAFQVGGMKLVADGLVAPAMTDVGLDWQAGKIDVMHEHQATEICSSILYQIVPLVEQSVSDQARVAVGCSPTNDYHQVASLLAQLLLAEGGWRAKSLGGGISAEQLELAITERKADLVWISVTNIPSVHEFVEEFTPVVQRIKSLNIAVLLGGQGVDMETAKRIGASEFGHQLTDIVRLAGPPIRS